MACHHRARVCAPWSATTVHVRAAVGGMHPLTGIGTAASPDASAGTGIGTDTDTDTGTDTDT